MLHVGSGSPTAGTRRICVLSLVAPLLFQGIGPAAVSFDGLNYLKSIKVCCEQANPDLRSFSGSVTAGDGGASTWPCTNREVIYRGCTVRNTEWAIGITCLTGM